MFKSNMALTGENFKIIVNYKMRKLWGGSRKNGVIPPEKQTKLVFALWYHLIFSHYSTNYYLAIWNQTWP